MNRDRELEMGIEKKKNEEESIGSEVDHFIYRVSKKNHSAMAQINKQFADMITKYGASHVVFQLNNTSTPMEGIVNIAKIIARFLMMKRFGWS